MNEHAFQFRIKNTDSKQLAVTLENVSHYMTKTFKSASDLDSIFKNFTKPTVARPTKPEQTDDAVEFVIFNEGIKEYVKRRNMLRDSVKRL